MNLNLRANHYAYLIACLNVLELVLSETLSLKKTRTYKYSVLGNEETYFVQEHSDSKRKYYEDDIIKMLHFLVDNIFVDFARKNFQ